MNARMPDALPKLRPASTRQPRTERSGHPALSMLAKQSVGFFRCDADVSARDHDMSTKADVARSIAALLNIGFDGDLTDANLGANSLGANSSAPSASRSGIYWVPSGTLLTDAAARMGIRGPGDLFGGVVPHPFVSSKVITHPLVASDAAAPQGWTSTFGDAVSNAVLPGFSVFSMADALAAGKRMLELGAVRIKRADGVGGAGQTVAATLAELRTQLDALDAAALQQEGLVLELNLEEVTTYSVGQVSVGPWVASYVGTQRLTPNHRGDEVYGGSDLVVVRGGFDSLAGMSLDPSERLAVEQTLSYHRLALASYPGLFASRCNYDVVVGADAAGRKRSGVLEQSWRIGGASAAEIAALIALRDDPSLPAVRAETHEHYSDDVVVPFGSLIHFDGKDAHGGPLLKYALVSPYVVP